MRHVVRVSRVAYFGLLMFAGLAEPAAGQCDFSAATLDAGGTTGWCTSIALSPDADPRIAYWDQSNDRLRFKRFDSVWVTETAADSGGFGASLELSAAGDARISHSELAGSLQYSRKSASGWATQIVDPNASGAGATSLELASTGYGRIAYISAPDANLRYATQSVITWSLSTVDTTGRTYALSLDLDASDLPHIAYYDNMNDDLRYARRTAQSTWIRETVQSAGDIGSYPSLVVDASGNPHISYKRSADNSLMYARKSGGVWTIETVARVAPGSVYNSLQLDGAGQPRISYNVAGAFNFFAYSWKSGGEWYQCTVESGDLGQFNSLALTAGGEPHVSYFNSETGDLKYATWQPTSVPAGGAARFALSVQPNVIGASGATIVYSRLAGGAGDGVHAGDAAAGDAAAGASLDLYDTAGRRVRSFAMAGERALHWDGRADDGRTLTQGVYFLRLSAPGGAAATQRLTIVR